MSGTSPNGQIPSRFNHHVSDTFQRAVVALQELLEAEGEGAVERAFAAVVADHREAAYAKRLNAHEQTYALSEPFWTVADLVPEETKDPGFSSEELEQDLRGDHESHWTAANDTPAAYTFQPYGLSWAWLCHLVDTCRKYGLQMDIDESHSWHFPGKSLLVEIRRRRSELDHTLYRML